MAELLNPDDEQDDVVNAIERFHSEPDTSGYEKWKKRLVVAGTVLASVLLVSGLIGVMVYRHYLVLEEERIRDNAWFLDQPLEESDHRLNLTLKNHFEGIDPVITTGRFNQRVKRLSGYVKSWSPTLLELKLSPSARRWDIQNRRAFTNTDEQMHRRKIWHPSISESGFTFEFNPFSFRYSPSIAGNKVLYSSTGCTFKFYDKYIQWDAEVYSEHGRLLGMGTHVEEFLLSPDARYPMYNVRRAPQVRANMYGTHPFMMYNVERNLFLGVYFHNSNAQSFAFRNASRSGTYHTSYITMGGVFNLFIIAPGTSDEVVQTYHNLVGKPRTPPVWSFGLGHNMVSARSITDYLGLINNYTKAFLPIDSIYGDSCTMDHNMSFTVDPHNFHNLNGFVEWLHTFGRKFVQRIDPFVSEFDKGLHRVGENYALFLNVSALSNMSVISDAGPAHFPDVLHPNISEFYSAAIHQLKEKSNVDGLMLTNNEPRRTSKCEKSKKIQHPNELFYRFMFNLQVDEQDLDDPDSLPLESKSNVGEDHYNFHSVYGWLQCEAIHNASASEGATFVVSRSSFPGTGACASSFLWDPQCMPDPLNETFQEMVPSIAASLSLMGVSHVGVPLSAQYWGSAPPAEDLFCLWYRAAAYLPLLVIHGTDDSLAAYRYGCGEREVRVRYGLIRYMYTKSLLNSENGGALLKLLWLLFPDSEDLAKEFLRDGFLIGDDLYVVTKRPLSGVIHFMLPLGTRWFSILNKEEYEVVGESQEKLILLDERLILQRNGTIIPYQDVSEQPIGSTAELPRIPYKLLIYAPEGHAKGDLVLDDGEGSDSVELRNHYSFEFYRGEESTFILKAHRWNTEYAEAYKGKISLIKVFGETLKEYSTTCGLTSDFEYIQLKVEPSQNSSLIHLSVDIENLQSLIFYPKGARNILCDETKYVLESEKEDDREFRGYLLESGRTQRLYRFACYLYTNNILNLKIVKQDASEFEVPLVLDEFISNSRKKKPQRTLRDYGLEIQQDPFEFSVLDITTRAAMLSTRGRLQMTYTRNFIHLPLFIRASHLYGLPGAHHHLELQQRHYTLWSGRNNNRKAGSHPFILIQKHNLKDFAALFLLCSSPVDLIVSKVGSLYAIEITAMSGVIDLFTIQGPSFGPSQVIQSYYSMIGRPQKPVPGWFGLHYGQVFSSPSAAEYHMNYIASFVRVDYMHFGIEYMNRTIPFSLCGKYSELLYFSRRWKEDVGTYTAISIPNYVADGNNLGDRLKNITTISNFSGKPLEGFDIPGKVYYPSLASNESRDCYTGLVEELLKESGISALCLDNNERYQQCDGECTDIRATSFRKRYIQDVAGIPFIYLSRNLNIFKNTLSLSAYDQGGVIELNKHPLYSLYQAKLVHELLQEKAGERREAVMLLTEATTPGIGQYAGHLISKVPHISRAISYLISAAYNYQLAGVSLFGADLCKSASADSQSNSYCLHTMELSSMFPFFRFWNTSYFIHAVQRFAEIYKKSVITHYSYVPYLIDSYLHLLDQGKLMIRPTFFDFPDDPISYNYTDSQFLLGDILLVAPKNLESDTTRIFFPKGKWLRIDGTYRAFPIDENQEIDLFKGLNGSPYVFQREGTIFAVHNKDYVEDMNRIQYALHSSIQINVAADEDHSIASGTFSIYPDSFNLSSSIKCTLKQRVTSIRGRAINFDCESHLAPGSRAPKVTAIQIYDPNLYFGEVYYVYFMNRQGGNIGYLVEHVTTSPFYGRACNDEETAFGLLDIANVTYSC